MIALNISEAARLAKGKMIGRDGIIKRVSTDSRDVDGDCLFAAIKGERFDGHDFVEKAWENGAACVLSSREITIPEGKSAIIVEDTRKALLALAGGYRNMFDIPVCAVTGSVGKTTTKDIIAAVLSQKYSVLKTSGNFNNDIGVPKTIFSIGEEHTAAVIEMGMNHRWEIDALASAVTPNIGVITNVGVSHIENLGSRDGILAAKCEMLPHIRRGGYAVLNGDDDMLTKIKGNESLYGLPAGVKILWYGMSPEMDVYAENIEPRGIDGVKCVIHTPKGAFETVIPVPGRHMVYNAMAAAAVGVINDMELEDIKNGIEGFSPTGMRMERIALSNGAVVIDDSYNANPVSVKAALDVLASCDGKKYAVLGDMLELGSFAAEMHREVGSYAAEKNIDGLAAIGAHSADICAGASEGGMENVTGYLTVDEFIGSGFVPEGTVLIKASHSMNFGRIADYFKTF